MTGGHCLLVVLGMSFLAGCGGDDPVPPPDARVILQAQLSHGIGYSPFDSPLVHDSVAAAMIVHARGCSSIDRLHGLLGDPAAAGRLLEELRSAGLLTLREGEACTTFPILLNEEHVTYAYLTSEVAREAYELLASDLDALLVLVEERGWREWQYHVVWSQFFDSQFAWTAMTQRSLVPPLGHLVAWVVYPGHPFRSGTNYFPDSELRDHWLMVSWRPGAANTIALLGNSWELIYGAALEGRSLSTEERAQLADLDLLDAEGQVQVPVLRTGDPLHTFLDALAVRYVRFLEQRMPLDSLAILSGVDHRHTFAMAYHDVSWDIVRRLVQSGRIEVPAALEPGATHARSSMRGVAALSPVYEPFADLVRTAIASR